MNPWGLPKNPRKAKGGQKGHIMRFLMFFYHWDECVFNAWVHSDEDKSNQNKILQKMWAHKWSTTTFEKCLTVQKFQDWEWDLWFSSRFQVSGFQIFQDQSQILGFPCVRTLCRQGVCHLRGTLFGLKCLILQLFWCSSFQRTKKQTFALKPSPNRTQIAFCVTKGSLKSTRITKNNVSQRTICGPQVFYNPQLRWFLFI